MPPEPCRSGLAIGSCHPRYPGTGLNIPARGRTPGCTANRCPSPILLLPCQIRPPASRISHASNSTGRPAGFPPANGVAGLGERASLSARRRPYRRLSFWCNQQWQNQRPRQAPCLRLSCRRFRRAGLVRQKGGTPPVAALGCRLWPNRWPRWKRPRPKRPLMSAPILKNAGITGCRNIPSCPKRLAASAAPCGNCSPIGSEVFGNFLPNLVLQDMK
jgi:hypothetical protein